MEQQEKTEAIEKAVKSMSRMVTNETHAWNLWNFLNTSEEFIEIFQVLHPEEPRNRRDDIYDAVWSTLEDELETNLDLDLNDVEDNQKFADLVRRVTNAVVENLKSPL